MERPICDFPLKALIPFCIGLLLLAMSGCWMLKDVLKENNKLKIEQKYRELL